MGNESEKVKKQNIFKRIFKKKMVKVFSILLVLALIFGGLVKFDVIKLNNSNSTATQQQRVYRVKKGSINVSVTGSGPITSSNKTDITPLTSSKLQKVYFKEGDSVKTGDLMYELDDNSARLKIATAQNNVAQTQLSQSTTSSDIKKLVVTAPISGVVSGVSAKSGDTIGKNADIATITDKSEVKLTVPFYQPALIGVKVGSPAKIFFSDSFRTINGKVSFINSKGKNTSEGTTIFDVDITVENCKDNIEGLEAYGKVTSQDGEQSSSDMGTITFADGVTVKTATGGTMKYLNIKDGMYVNAGETIAVLENDDLDMTRQTTELKAQDLQTQLSSAVEDLNNYRIYAPIDGIITSQETSVVAGVNVKEGTVLSTISDLGHMEFEITIDELDIAKIKIGQKVNVTVDALTETTSKPIAGEVYKIAMEGTSTNGVTTYPVTIRVNETTGLKVGMNANAEIMISEKSNVLVVPLEAIQKMRNKNTVRVKESTQGQNQAGQNTDKNFPVQQNGSANAGNNRTDVNRSNSTKSNSNSTGSTSKAQGQKTNSSTMKYYENTTMRTVEVGVNNDEYIEIKSGLQEGESIVLPQLTTSTSTQNSNQMQGGFGGIGGPMGGDMQRDSGSRTGSSSNRSSSSNGTR